MALNSSVLRSRLREAFGTDPQDVVAKNLNMTQGSISKILSGNQQPTLETIYHVAEAYGVSVDWLLGLSEKKRVTKYAGETTYTSSVEAIGDIIEKGAKISNDKKNSEAVLHITDPLLRMLLRKSKALMDADHDLHQDWLSTKLSLFEDKPLLYTGEWEDRDVSFLVKEAVNESDWIETYKLANKKTQEFAEMMGDDVSPFSR